MSKTIIVAELGLNHQGSLDTALRLIDISHRVGADVVKFQKRTPEIALARHLWDVPKQTPWGTTEPYLEYRRKMEFGKGEYDTIDEYCKRLGILWTASVWDVPSLEFLLQYDVPFIKIPSAHLTNEELVFETARTKIPVVLSTGMSTEEEIDLAVETSFLQTDDLTLLHCHAAYPTPPEEISLKTIQTLRERYGRPVGFSSHATSPFVSIAAMWRYDACMIEAHLTFDRAAPGSDHSASLEEDGFALIVRERDRMQVIDGDGTIRVWESEIPKRKSLRL